MNILIFIFAFIILTCIGSFIGVCYERIPREEQIIKGRSHCDTCGRTLKVWELIPVFSFIFLRGKCVSCKSKIPVSSTVIELLTAIFGIIPLIVYGVTVQGFIYCSVSCILFEIALLDSKTMEISDLACILIAGLGVGLMFCNGTYVSSAIGLICVSVPFLILALFKMMGFGDVKLMAAVGILLGFKGVLLAAFFGITVGCIAAIIKKIRKTHGWKSEMAFGPYLCIGTYMSLLIGEKCLELYLSLF